MSTRPSRARRARHTAKSAGSDRSLATEGASPGQPSNQHLPHAIAIDRAMLHAEGAALSGGLDAKVLVLNRFYMAIRVISAKRAFAMLARDAAEVIHVDDGKHHAYSFSTWAEISDLQRRLEPHKHDWVRTVHFEIAVPKVIRLLGYDRLPAQTVKLNRRNLFARDRNRCQYCGGSYPTSELSIDHVTPRTQGGQDTWENLVCACVRCNAKKGGRTPEQAHMRLITKPVRPKRNPAIVVRLGQQKYESWRAFLNDAYWSVELG